MSDERTTTLATAEPDRDDAARSSTAIVERAGRSSGRPLDPQVRAYMEPRFGHDFGRVRVHTDARAAATARELRADAFTSGQDVWFGAGRYDGGTAPGRRLIAHELVHTLQQRAPGTSAVVQLYRSGTTLDDPLERQADSAARRVGSGGAIAPGEVSVGVPGARLEVARQASAQAVEESEPPAVIDALAEGMRAALEDDPHDTTRGVSAQLRRLAARTRGAVVARLRSRLAPALVRRLAEILAAPAPPEAERPAMQAEAGLDTGGTSRDGSGQEEGRGQTAEGPEAAEVSPSDLSPDERRGAATGAEPVVRPASDAVAAVGAAVRPAVGLPADPAAGLAEPAEPESTGRAEAAEAAHPPDQLATESVAAMAEGGAAVEDAPPEGEAGAAMEQGAVPPAGDGAPPGPAAGAEESEPAATVDPAIGEETPEERREEAEDDAALAEGQAPAPTRAAPPAPVAPEGDVAAPVPAEAAAVEDGGDAGSTAEPQEPTPARGSPPEAPETMPADAEVGEPSGAEAEEAAAESALDDAAPGGEAAEAPLTPGGGPDAAVRLEAAAEEGTEAAEPEPGGPEGSIASEPDSAEQGGEPAAEPGDASGMLGEDAAAMLEDETAAEGGGDVGGGGGGGGSAIEDPPPAEIPDVAGVQPEAGIDQVAALPPTAAAAALGGVSAAATRTVGDKRTELAANPPKLDRPSGAPAAAEAAAEGAAPPPTATGPTQVERTPAGAAGATPQPEPLPPAPAPPTAAVRDPQVGGPDAQMTEAEAAAIRDSVRALPTSDPALHVNAGAPPPLTLEGDSDPARAAEQRAALDRATGQARAQAADDAAAPMGEAAVLPTVPPEKLRAEIGGTGAVGGAAVPGGVSAAAPAAAGRAGAGGGGGATAPASGPDPAIDAIAAERSPGEIQAGAATAKGQMAGARAEQVQGTEAAQAESRTAVETAVTENAAEQRAERDAIRSDVRGQRAEWTSEQRDLVDRSQHDADAEGTKAATDIATEREKGTKDAAKHIETGNQDVGTARETAEREATVQRRKGEEDSGGILDWFASKAKAFFDGIKAAISKAFEVARAAVKAAIEKAQKLAAEVIEKARKAIVAAITLVGDALIKIGDFVLAGFPELRDKFRAAIKKAVDTAVVAVNKLADALKKAVQALLDLLGKALDAVLGLLEKALLAYIDAYAAVVNSVIKAAHAVLTALADFAEIVRDVAAGPAAWIRNLGSAIADGISNHLWAALKNAVKNWFNGKVEAVLGLGTMIWNVLRKGGITLVQIGKFAFAALAKAIPIALIKLLIEKLVAMLVPAAAAVMAIIEGLQAAWGTVGQMLQAFSKFIAFLKAVKGGAAGPRFAELLSAAAVVVIEFVSNWLVAKLLKPIAAVAKAIKEIVGKIAAKLKKLMQAVKRGLKKATKKVKKFVKRQMMRLPKSAKRTRKGKKKDKRQQAADRMAKARRELPPKIHGLIRRGASAARMFVQLGIWRLAYGLRTLRVVSQDAGRAKVVASASPEEDVVRGVIAPRGPELQKLIRKVADDLFKDAAVKKRAQDIARQRLAGRGKTREDPIITGPAGHEARLGRAADIATEQREKGSLWHQIETGSATGVAHERQTFSGRVGHTRVSMSPADYQTIAKTWTETGADPAQRVRLVAILDTEAGRSRSNAVVIWNAVLAAERTAAQGKPIDPRGHVTFPQALTTLNPAEPKGAVRNLAELNKRLGFPEGSPGEFKAPPDETTIALQTQRELDLLVGLVYQAMSLEKLSWDSHEAVEKFVDGKLRDMLFSNALLAMRISL